ncbi:MAG: site-2 protease family protein [Paenibacillaceae bacterium]|nr:site-2 protease family protein [Paenibacillaceae bacterium]
MAANKNRRRKGPLWALGAVGAFVLTKAKTILSLIKLGTVGGAVFSMLVSVGAYALLAPLKLAIALVVMVLIHELGHVFAAHRKGLPTSAPVFIPLFGALVNMKRHPRDATTEAYIAFGGPLLGTAGALVSFWIGWQWDSPLFIAAAYLGFFLNIVNLIPVMPLDGAKIVVAVSRSLWIAGLGIGLFMIVKYRLYLLLLFWLWFAWDLWQKYRARQGVRHGSSTWASFEVFAELLLFEGTPLPAQEHQRDVDYTTYSDLTGKQFIVMEWSFIGFRGKLQLPEQAIIRRARIVRFDRKKKDNGLYMIVRCQVEYDPYLNDAYYDVPAASRWKFGVAYGLLAALLGVMLYVTAGIGI